MAVHIQYNIIEIHSENTKKKHLLGYHVIIFKPDSTCPDCSN